MTDRVIVIHRVDDFDWWKQHFDAAAELRRDGGETSYEVLRADGERNVVVHQATWTSLDAAREFFESPEVVEIRRAAGVQAPTFLYLTVADPGSWTVG